MGDSDKQTSTTKDDSLDALLNSSLADFDTPLPKLPSSKVQTNSASGSAAAVSVKDPKPSEASQTWNEEYAQFENAMKDLLSDDSSMKKDFTNLVENLKCSTEGSSSCSKDNFAETFADTIRGLTESAQNIPDPTPDELANLLKDFDLGDGNPLDGNQVPDFMPLMQSVMQNLMSKELLYPSLKEIVDKYPDWLANKRSSLLEDEYEKYNRQYDLMKQVCEEFEVECDDTDDAKKARFEKVLMLMQKVQTYGNPPKELVGEIGPGLPLDEHGNMQIPGMPEQCSIM